MTPTNPLYSMYLKTVAQGSMTLSGMTITIIVAVLIIFTLMVIMTVVLSLTILYFKKREGKVFQPQPAPVYETMASSPRAASNVELMEIKENAAYASSIIPKENVAYGTSHTQK